MKKTDLLRIEMDLVWEQYMLPDWGSSKDAASSLKALVKKLKKIKRELMIIQVRKLEEVEKKYLKAFMRLLSKRIELCNFLISEFNKGELVDGNKFDVLKDEMKEKENEFLATMQRRW
ncbi:hypothetical protein [Enterococcus asini]|uniref:hypothetical protein n=1 Tax=Enterococcus asini TaxID=57732 RepID=UPI001E4E4EDD|nr:hypothetical protein [Enterococcus asini]MCD5030183.1 hypothetical protein [Enterococcus asini]